MQNRCKVGAKSGLVTVVWLGGVKAKIHSHRQRADSPLGPVSCARPSVRSHLLCHRLWADPRRPSSRLKQAQAASGRPSFFFLLRGFLPGSAREKGRARRCANPPRTIPLLLTYPAPPIPPLPSSLAARPRRQKQPKRRSTLSITAARFKPITHLERLRQHYLIVCAKAARVALP